MHNSTISASINYNEREPGVIMAGDTYTGFYISYAGTDGPLTEWFAWLLERAEYPMVIKVRDFDQPEISSSRCTSLPMREGGQQ